MIETNSAPGQYGNWATNNNTVTSPQLVYQTRRRIESGDSVADFHSGNMLRIVPVARTAIAAQPNRRCIPTSPFRRRLPM